MDLQEEKDDFLVIIEQNKGIIYKIAHIYCKDEDDRKDLIQEITIQLWRSYGRYNQQSKFSTWMYRVALNVAITFYRKGKRRSEFSTRLYDNVIDIADQPLQDIENITLLQQFINELNDLDRALMLLYLEEKSQKEMAEILGLSETNIGTKVSRIKEKLKKRFSTINTI